MQNVTTTKPDERPPFIEWCKMFNISTVDKNLRPIDNIKRITELWNGYLNMKENFKKPINQNKY